MPPLRRSNARCQRDRRTDATTDRVDAHVITCLFSPSNLEDAHPHRVGFVLLRGTQGRAPSVPLLLPPESMERALPAQPGAWEGKKRDRENRV